MELWKQELYHHGILGMKWGRRNGPPYPLSVGAHSPDEIKADWKKSLGGGRNESLYDRHKKNREVKTVRKDLKNTKIGKLNGRTLVSEKSSTTAAKLGYSTALAILATGLMSNEIMLSDNPSATAGKAFLMNLGLGAGIVFGASAIADHSYSKDKKNNIQNNNSFSELKKIKKRHSETQDQAAVNPRYEKASKYQMNCTMCTTAYEMRRRGYDVEANGTEMGRSTRDAAAWFNVKDDNIYDFDNYSDFETKIKSMPDGSRGNVCAEVGPFLSSHSMVWEKRGNSVIIRDCQTNTTYNSLGQSIINEDGTMFEFFRTDNAVVNEDLIMDAIRKAE